MTRKQLAKSIIAHLRLLARSDLREAYGRYRDCFMSVDIETISNNNLWVPTYIHRESYFESWPKHKLEQVLLDILRDELNQVRLSSYATDRANQERETRKSLITTGEMKSLDIWDPANTSAIQDKLNSTLYSESVVRCVSCMSIIKRFDGHLNNACSNPTCIKHSGF